MISHQKGFLDCFEVAQRKPTVAPEVTCKSASFPDVHRKECRSSGWSVKPNLKNQLVDAYDAHNY
jgi:hypothetical protein